MSDTSYRSYAMMMLAVAFTLFFGVAGANLLIDPEGVLGTGVLGAHQNVNDRYLRLTAYQANASRYDGLMFGSSRGPAIPLTELSQRMGATFAQMSVSAGQLADYLAFLDYAIRTAAEHDQKIRAVFLLLDVDLFGSWPQTNSIQTLMPPALTGEPPWRFKWRYLTAIQPKAWRADITRALAARHDPPRVPEPLPQATESSARQTNSPVSDAPAPPAGGDPTVATRDAAHGGEDAGAPSPVAPPPPGRDASAPSRPGTPLELVTRRKRFAHDLVLLERFVALCRRQDIRLVVAFSPLHELNAVRYDRADLDRAADRITDIVPVWNFGVPAGLSQRPDLWRDYSHFLPEVGRMMTDRIFGAQPGSAPPDFGVLQKH